MRRRLIEKENKASIHIDWEIRYKLMRLHFAAEIIMEIVFHKMSSIEKNCTHISQGKARLEYFTAHNISNFFPNILIKVQFIIDKNDERKLLKVFIVK
tara:strand:- start:789 stop:1082 length:294 start_codon:yes stop_codon:yes gene_type:complete